MTFLKKYKYTIIFLIVLTIGGLMLNANYYINKRPITADKRVTVQNSDISFFDYTRVVELDRHTDKRVLLGFHPDFDWSEETTYSLSNELEPVDFEISNNDEYMSITTEINPKGNDKEISFDVKKGLLYRPVYYADIEMVNNVVDVYNMFGRYQYSLYIGSYGVISDTQELYYIDKDSADKLGLK